MAKMSVEMPTALIDSLQRFEDGLVDMEDAMLTEAGKVVYQNVTLNAQKVFKNPRTVLQGLILSKHYSTGDGARNIKVMFKGYVPNSRATEKYPKGKPIPLIAAAREYGTSQGEDKRPFFRKSFSSQAIADAMERAQEKYLPEG